MSSTVPGESWTSCDDALELGFDRDRLLDVGRAVEALGSGAFVVIAGGRVALQLGAVDRRWIVQSARKSLLSVLFGVLWDRGQLELDATLADLGIDDTTALTDVERTATVEHLLQSRSGVFLPAAAEYQSVAAGRPSRGSHLPGTHTWYNNWDFNVAGTIFSQLAGRSVYEAFREWIATPTGMEDYRLEDGRDTFSPVSKHPAYHFVMSARDLARFGLLAARNGRWGETQLVSEAWMRRSTSCHTPIDATGFGYGYMWWVGDPAVADGHAWFAARGGAGHVVWAVPDLDLVVVHRNPGLVDSPTWQDIEPLLAHVLAARIGSATTPPPVPRDAARPSPVALGDGWCRHERSDLGLSFDVPEDWRTADNVGFGERIRATWEDGWTRRTFFVRREPWLREQRDDLVAKHIERLSATGSTTVQQAPSSLDGRDAVEVRWTTADGRSRYRWYIATDGRERYDISVLESGPADDALIDRVVASCRMYEPELTDVQRRLRSVAPVHPVSGLPLNLDSPISDNYEFLAPRRVYPGQDDQRRKYQSRGLRGGYIRSWTGSLEGVPSNLQVFLLRLGGSDIAGAYLQQQLANDDELDDIGARTHTFETSGRLATTIWLVNNDVVAQISAIGDKGLIDEAARIARLQHQRLRESADS